MVTSVVVMVTSVVVMVTSLFIMITSVVVMVTSVVVMVTSVLVMVTSVLVMVTSLVFICSNRCCCDGYRFSCHCYSSLLWQLSAGSYECSSENRLSSGRLVQTPAYRKILRVQDVSVVSSL